MKRAVLRLTCAILLMLLPAVYSESAGERCVSGIVITDYTQTVNAGRIRFVCQQYESADRYGWGRYARDRSAAHGPAGNCTTAVQSMAFSYIGINAQPESIVSQITNFRTNYGFEEADTAYRTGYSATAEHLDRFLDRFLTYADDGIISPVIVHYRNGGKNRSLHQHSVLVIGKDEEGRYIAIDPAREWEDCIKTFTLKKGKNGRAYLSGDVARGNENVYLDAIEQYYLIGSGIL